MRAKSSVKFGLATLLAKRGPFPDFSEKLCAMEFAAMRHQIVRESVLRMRDVAEIEDDTEGLLGITRITLAHGAIGRHKADLFVQ
jgi:hypothetical protein